MLAIRIISWTARIAGTLALLLGLTIWAITMFAPTWLDLRNYHMVLGLLVTLALLGASVVAFSVKGLWPAGLLGLVYTAFLPYFGISQAGWVQGNLAYLHWLIQLAHLIVGVGAVAFVQFVTARFESNYKATHVEVTATS